MWEERESREPLGRGEVMVRPWEVDRLDGLFRFALPSFLWAPGFLVFLARPPGRPLLLECCC